MENSLLKVEGMDCNSCAISITKTLEKQGLENVRVNYASGDVSFINTKNINSDSIEKNIENLGYKVVKYSQEKKNSPTTLFKNHWQRFLVCFIFSVPLFVAHIFHIHWLMNPIIQLSLATVVYIVGMGYFGKSAVKSLINGYPNMNVLIALGTTAAYAYSLYGLLIGKADEFMFFETTATTITLVLLGNFLEEKTTKQTQQEVKKLLKTQITKATMIAFDDAYQEQLFVVDSKDLKVGDLILIKTGEQVPADCKILWGEGLIDESIITGESLPLDKKQKDILTGGSVVVEGIYKAQVTAAGNDTVLAQIIRMIQEAQNEKPPMQKLADKISAIFIPVVSVPVLSNTTCLMVLKVSKLVASLNKTPFLLALPKPTEIAAGVANPIAQGQEITSTAIDLNRLSVKLILKAK